MFRLVYFTWPNLVEQDLTKTVSIYTFLTGLEDFSPFAFANANNRKTGPPTSCDIISNNPKHFAKNSTKSMFCDCVSSDRRTFCSKFFPWLHVRFTFYDRSGNFLSCLVAISSNKSHAKPRLKTVKITRLSHGDIKTYPSM